MELNETLLEFDEAAERMIELGNRLIDADDESDRWEVASGLLAGAVPVSYTHLTLPTKA